MSIKRLHELLNSDKDAIKINKDLLKTLDLEEAVLYSYLVSDLHKHYKNIDFKSFNDDVYFLCNVEDIEKAINFSPFRQRNALNKLQKKGLLKVKLGQARARYICINENPANLERILFGVAVSDFAKEFNDYIERQVEQFKEQNNLYINNKYLIDYGTPWETKFLIDKHINLNDNFNELGIGWLTKEIENDNTFNSKISA